jgi:transcriptional regulator with XRE-family HTH domain
MTQTALRTSDPLKVMKLGKHLKDLLKSSDTTVAQLSRATGVSSKTLYKWIDGQNPRDISQVKKIAIYFEKSVDELCFGDSPSAKKSPIEAHQAEINAGIFEVVLRKVPV